MNYDFNPTTKQRHNLAKLADYLDALPDDYGKFFMGEYYVTDGYMGRSVTQVSKESLENECGSCACAIGHGPAAGIRRYSDTTWWSYAQRVFGTCDDMTEEGDYMFGSDKPNCPKQAAQRIREVLAGEYDAT